MKIITKVETTFEVDFGDTAHPMSPGDFRNFTDGLKTSWVSGQIKDMLVVGEIIKQVYGYQASAKVVKNVFEHTQVA
jgi:hypothetical protein